MSRAIAIGVAAVLCACSKSVTVERYTLQGIDAGVLPEPLDVPSPGLPDPPGPPPPAELTIQYIQRLPKMDWVWASSNPTVEGWPAPGQQVTWRAYVKNWFPTSMQVGYRWLLNGREAARGTLEMPAGDVVTTDFLWPWTFERHALAFEIDPDGLIGEEEEHDNLVSIDTDALSVGFWVEQSLYDWFRAHQHDLPGARSTSFEDWAQRQIVLYNELFARAVWPETPHGVLERVRLDQIVLVPDGALPLDGLTTNSGFAADMAKPDARDRSVDLEWGFPKRALTAYQDLTHADLFNQFYWYSGFLQHELGHARSMIDVYGMWVYDALPGHQIDIREAGEPVVGRFLRRERIEINGSSGGQVYVGENGLMAQDWRYLDRLSAIVWNELKGQRARFGNFNEPQNIGWFLNDLLPPEVRVRIVDGAGRPLAGAAVEVFQGTAQSPPAGPLDLPYGRRYDDAPDLRATTDADGEVSLGRNPFAGSGPIIHLGSFSNATVIVRAEKDGGVGYFFLTAGEVIEKAADQPGAAVTAVLVP